MKYAKLIDGYLSYAPNPINDGANWISNPSDKIYLEHGYKPIVYTVQPEPLEYGYYTEIWTETSTEIVQGWKWIQNDEVGSDEAMEILFGDDN